MDCLGIKLSAIEARRYTPEVSSGVTEDFSASVSFLKLDKLDDKDAAIEFRYSISYIKSGAIAFTGTVNIRNKADEQERLFFYWNEHHDIPAELKEFIEGIVREQCTAEAVSLALLVHLPLPLKEKIPHYTLNSKFKLSLIDAKRFSKHDEKFPSIQIGHGTSISQIMSVSSEAVSIEFRYTVTFTNMGILNIEGHYIYECDVSALTQTWLDSKKLEPKESENIINSILAYGSFLAISLCRKIELPYPVKVETPKIKAEGPVKPSEPPGIEVT
ncbi:MAG: hypothetical protein QW728_04520 [Thermoplasmata archaeon]